MKKLKIMRIITRLNIGGPSIHVVNLNYGLQSDYDCILISGQIEPHESDMSYYADKYKIPVRYLKQLSREISFPGDLIALWEIFKLIKKEKPDIVHTHTAKAGTLGRFAAFFAGVPIIIHTFHGNIFKGYFSPKKTKLFTYIEKVLSLISTKIIAISEKQKQELLNLKITNTTKISVIKLGFDFSNVLAEKSDHGIFRKKYGISMDKTIIAIVGRITAIKNHLLFINIAEKLLKFYPDLVFPIIGDGDLRQCIEDEILKRNLTDKIFITGFIEDLKPVYSDVDIVLLTSHNEGTPVALIEAMINGKIILSTNVGGISDFIDNNKNGFYFNDPNPDLFVKTLSKILNKEYDTNKISENAKKTASEYFSVNRLINEVKDLYEELYKP